MRIDISIRMIATIVKSPPSLGNSSITFAMMVCIKTVNNCELTNITVFDT